MNAQLERSSRFELQEAIREIELMAGLTEVPRPLLAAAPLELASGGSAPAEGAPAMLRMRMRPQVIAHGTAPLPGDSPRPLAIGVTSVGHGEGKTTLSISLASSLAADLGAQVTLVDADFHTQSIARIYGLEGKRGLTDVLSGGLPTETAVHRYLRSPLGVVPAGTTAADAARLARSADFAAFIDNLKAISGFVILDLPASLESVDAAVLARRCDAVIVVVRDGATSRQELERLLNLLAGANVLGVVVNRHRTSIPGFVERMLGLVR